MRLAEFFRGVNPVVSQVYHRAKEKTWHSTDLPKDVFVLVALCLIGLGGFILEKIISTETSRKGELRIVQNSNGGSGGVGNATATNETIRGMYVASKTGAAYYLPWCGSVKRIKEENKIWFSSREEAEATGYKPAANCKGI